MCKYIFFLYEQNFLAMSEKCVLKIKKMFSLVKKKIYD